jgi:hypothetical protein
MREKSCSITRRLEAWAFVTFSFTTRWRVAQEYHVVNQWMGTDDHIF